MSRIRLCGAFDDMRSHELRVLQEAAEDGPLTVSLWSDEAFQRLRGRPPKWPLAERRYFLEALRYVDRVEPASWEEAEASAASPPEERTVPPGFPYRAPALDAPRPDGLKRVVVTGCFDWFHSGHIRFFEEAAEYGELNVIIGSDANVRLLKGQGHPLFGQEERRYMVGSIRSVARCLISSGSGWMDAEPEIRALGAERYLVNEDGDKEEKRRFCEENGIEYLVLKRVPKEGLPRRSSTGLRGF
jgi:cytidyltransferase-like protein